MNAYLNLVNQNTAPTWKPEMVMIWTMVVASSWLHVVTEARVVNELTSTDEFTEVIWEMVRLEAAFPRFTKVCTEISVALMLDAKAAFTFKNKYFGFSLLQILNLLV